MALNPRSTLPVPMISVTSYQDSVKYQLLISFTYAGIIRLEQSNLDTFVSEVALGLGQVEWCMVGRRVPEQGQYYICIHNMNV